MSVGITPKRGDSGDAKGVLVAFPLRSPLLAAMAPALARTVAAGWTP